MSTVEQGQEPLTQADLDAISRRADREAEVVRLLRDRLDTATWALVLEYAALASGDSHHWCDLRQDENIERLARHFGPLGPAIRAVYHHVEESDGAPVGAYGVGGHGCQWARGHDGAGKLDARSCRSWAELLGEEQG